jgi:hypothetical protein
MQNQTFLQKVANILNASSKTFMLIALVSLFVLPVVIAKNLEPVVRADGINDLPRITMISDGSEVNITAVRATMVPNVLGVSDSKDMKAYIAETSNGITLLGGASNYKSGEYALKISTAKKFTKTEIFKISNKTDSIVKYELSAVVEGNPKAVSNTSKVVSVDGASFTSGKAYTENLTVGSNTLPKTIELQPGTEVVISLASSKTSPTNLSVGVKLLN